MSFEDDGGQLISELIIHQMRLRAWVKSFGIDVDAIVKEAESNALQVVRVSSNLKDSNIQHSEDLFPLRDTGDSDRSQALGMLEQRG